MYRDAMPISKLQRKPRVRFCNLCANEIGIYAYGLCFHPICFKCSTELRIFQQDQKCPLCNIVLHRVLLTTTCDTQDKLNIHSHINAAKYSNEADDGVWCDTMETFGQYISFLRLKKLQTGGAPSQRKKVVIKDPNTMQDVTNDVLNTGKQVDWISVLQQPTSFSTPALNQDTTENSTGTEKLHEKNNLKKDVLEPRKPGDTDASNTSTSTSNCTAATKAAATSCAVTPTELRPNEKDIKVASLNGMVTKKPSYNQVLKEGKESKPPVKSSNVISPGPKPTAGSLKGNESKPPGKLNNIMKSKSTDGSLKGYGKIINLSLAFGFIERDDYVRELSENVFFNLPSCGYGPSDDLRKRFQLGDRVYFHAVPHADERSPSKWKATYVSKLPIENGNKFNAGGTPMNEAKNNITGNMKTPTSKPSESKEELKGPSFGFIIPQGSSGSKYSENVYFDLRSFSAGAGKNVRDLTHEFHINETVYYELEGAKKSSKRPADKQFRAVIVRKGKNGLPKSKSVVTHPPTSSKTYTSNIVGTKVISDLEKNSGNMGFTAHGDGGNKKDVSRIQFVTDSDDNEFFVSLDGFETNPLDLSTANEFEVFRNVLRELFRGKLDDSLFDFDITLAANNLLLKQVAFIHFSQKQSPIIYFILIPSLPPHHCITIREVQGFDADAMRRMKEKEMIVQGEDDTYFVENSNIYMMLCKDAMGRIEDVFLHTGF